MTFLVPPVDTKLRFDHKSTPWRVRASTSDTRYTLATASMSGTVFYTIIDWADNQRGPMNVIGGGLGIFTSEGADEAIDEAIQMLESGEGWELSRRHSVPLDITAGWVPTRFRQAGSQSAFRP